MHPHVRLFSILFTCILVLLAAGFVLVAYKPVHYNVPLVREAEKTIEDITNGTGSSPSIPDYISETHNTPKESSSNDLPPSFLIEVPFMTQAPTGNWNMPFQEACEETSLLMVHHFLEGTTMTPASAEKEILDMVDWENTTFNYSADVTVEELKQIAEDYFHHTGQLFYDFTIEDMKRLLTQGHPIIVPLAGRDIGNPYYSGAGPWYHMLVITGYDGNMFITNDVGTKRGHNYRYPEERLYSAIHNWNMQKEDIRNGKKVIMILEK